MSSGSGATISSSSPEAGWGSRSEYMGVGVTGKTRGLLGLGNIGAEICMLIHPFDVRTIAYDPFVDEFHPLGRARTRAWSSAFPPDLDADI